MKQTGVLSVNRLIKTLLEILLATGLGVIILLVLLQVTSRYAFQLSIRVRGTEEVARLVFVWCCFLGVGLSSFRRDHIRMELLLTKFTPKVLKMISCLNSLIIMTIAVMMVIYGSQFVVSRWMYPDYSTVLLYPRALFWLPIPICGLLIVGGEIQTFISLFLKDKPGG